MLSCWLLPLVCLLGAAGADGSDPPNELAAHFGFGPMQIYKIDSGIRQMRIADLDMDGRADIALWNRWKNRIELFYQTDTPAEAIDESDPDNEILDRGTMRRANIPVAASIESLEIAELTGDGRPDLVYFGEPRELVVLPGKAGGGFDAPIAHRAPGGDPRSGGLTVGDYNGDGRTDVALRGENQILLFHQQPDGRLAKPRRLMHDLEQPLLLLTADLNADGRDDLVMSLDDETFGMVAFLQDQNGGIGPMQRLRLPRVRSITVAAGAEGGDELYCVESSTNRLRQLRWQNLDASRATDWPMLLYSYPVSGKARQRPLAIGDVTGDGLDDVVALDGKSAQMVLFRGGPTGLLPGEVFPGLADATGIAIGDADGEGAGDLLIVSPKEKAIGISSFRDGRLTYPRPLDLSGDPLAGTLATLGGQSRLITIVREKHEDETRTRVQILDRDGVEQTGWEIEKLKDDPAGIRVADLNQDGRDDILVFVAFSGPLTWLQQPDGSFEALTGRDARESLVSDAQWNNHALADLTGDGLDELVVAQEKRARSLRIEGGRWTVVDQYNPDDGEAQLGGLAVLAGGGGNPTIAVYERRRGRLQVMQRGAGGTYAVTRTMPVGTFESPTMRPIRLGIDQKPGLLLGDAGKLAILEPGTPPSGLVEVASYVSDLKDVWLADCVVGDFNHDAVRDLVVVDIRRAFLELLTQPGGDPRVALQFQVFQGKRFSDEPDRGGEPHQVLAGDLTGDGTDDVALLVHDRLIIYPGQ